MILGIGFPRSGTTYTSKLLQSWNLDVKHETEIGTHGIIDSGITIGLMQTNDISQMKKICDWGQYKHIIHIIRNPFRTINSAIYHSGTFAILSRFLGNEFNVNDFPKIDAMIEMHKRVYFKAKDFNLKPTFTFRVESDHGELFNHLKDDYNEIKWNDELINESKINHKGSYSEINFKELNLLPEHKEYLQMFCELYGYDLEI